MSWREAIAVNLPIGSFFSSQVSLPLVLRFIKQLSPKIVVSVDKESTNAMTCSLSLNLFLKADIVEVSSGSGTYDYGCWPFQLAESLFCANKVRCSCGGIQVVVKVFRRSN